MNKIIVRKQGSYIAAIIGMVALLGCAGPMKLAIPETFRRQATVEHVSGARGNKMTAGKYTTSKIKRGVHRSYPGWNRGFLLENLLLNQVGIQKNEIVRKEKARFRYLLSGSNYPVEIYGDEKEIKKTLEYKLVNSKNDLFDSYSRLQNYNYVFSVIITGIPGEKDKPWELLMTNLYDRKKEQDKKIITILRPDDNGLATNGEDSIFIKPVSIRETESANGKKGKLPFKILSGYELSMPGGGVIAIIDLIARDIWYYNELDEKERLVVTAISTAIFARKVNDTKW